MIKSLMIAVLLLTGLLWFIGCSSTSLSLTGGSIPIGDIDGNVYRDPAFLMLHSITGEKAPPPPPPPHTPPPPMPSLQVTLNNAEGDVLQRVSTDANGYFVFHHVSGTGLQVIAQSQLLSARMDVDIASNKPVHISMLLTQISSQVDHFDCIPDGAPAPLDPNTPLQVKAGVDVSLSATGYMGATTSPNLPVSWSVMGPAGVVSPVGVFQATQPGTYQLIVQYGPNRKVYTVQVTGV